MESYQEIKEFLNSHEGIEGVLTVEIALREQTSEDRFEDADSYVVSLGYAGLGTQWQVLEKKLAIELLSSMLHRSLAYKVEMMPLKTAAHVATTFVSLFDPSKSVFLSNGHISEGLASWMPITNSTFEMAIVVMDQERIGIVCSEDED